MLVPPEEELLNGLAVILAWIIAHSLAVFGFFFGCCCGCPTPANHDFSTDVSAEYDEPVGDLTFSSGEGSSTDAAGLWVLLATLGSGRGYLSGRAKLSASGSGMKFRIVAYIDDDNYLYAELTINGASSTLKIWKVVSGGAPVQVGSTHTFTGSINTYYTITLCWDGVQATASRDGTDRTSGSYTGEPELGGFGWDISSGTITWTSFSFSGIRKDNDECPVCRHCGFCSDQSQTMTLVIEGVTNGTCSSCAGSFDGTWVMDQFTQNESCCWQSETIETFNCNGGFNPWHWQARVITSLGVALVKLNFIGGAGSADTLEGFLGTLPANCLEFEPITLDVYNTSSFQECVLSSAVATISAP